MPSIDELLKSHQIFTKKRNWDCFQSPKNLSMAISVEASELLELFTWLSEEQSLNLSNDEIQKASHEIADILLYLLRLSHVLGIDPLEAAKNKMIENEKNHPVEKSKEIASSLAKRRPFKT